MSVVPHCNRPSVGREWPGDVRELQNVIERTVIVSIARVLKLEIEELHLWVESKEEIRTHTLPWPVINCSDGIHG
jgi:transcriptional regulator with PAS, ATPase and Fis domain